jgi:hypothetical protein
MTNWMISGVLGFGAGGAFIWFLKDKIQALVIDANTLSAQLHAKADALLKK